jgi:hypothetical protein
MRALDEACDLIAHNSVEVFWLHCSNLPPPRSSRIEVPIETNTSALNKKCLPSWDRLYSCPYQRYMTSAIVIA